MFSGDLKIYIREKRPFTKKCTEKKKQAHERLMACHYTFKISSYLY